MNARIRNSRLKHLAYDLSRINEWWLLSLGMMLFAFVPYTYVQNGNSLNAEGFMGMFLDPPFYIAALVVFSSQIFLFASNDYFDRHVDALDSHKRMRNPVCRGDVSVSGVRALLVVSCIVPALAAAYFGIWTLAFTVLTLSVFYFYTAPPLRFKNKVGLDVISHGIFVNTFPYFFCLVALSDFTTGTTYLLTAIIMRSIMAQLFQEIRDYHVDKQVENNTVVVLGQRRALWVVLSIYAALFILTVSLMASYILWGWGIKLYYVIILILWFTYMPVFYKLAKSKDLGKSIERLWMGQGRTNRWQVVQYVSAFSVYALLMSLLWHIGHI